jgi:hypothetical protein
VHSAVATYKATQSPYFSGAAYKEDAGSVFRALQKGGKVTSGRCTRGSVTGEGVSLLA